MSVIINRKERFATEGVRFQRHNGDGTIPSPQRFLGFANTADVSQVVVNDEADLFIKIDAQPVMIISGDFSEVADLSQMTVDEAVLAFSGSDGVVFSKDPVTGRLKGSASSGKIIQCVGPLAAAMDFGQSVRHGGNGLEVISFFDDETISIGLPKDVKDKEEIDIESAKGSITRMIIGAMLQGMSPVVTTKVKDYFLLELVQGGRLDRKTGTYDPPLSHESEHPTFWGEIFSAVYSIGSNKLSDVAGYERLLLRSMIGMEGDVPIEAKSWASYAMNLAATEYTDENGNSFPAWQEQAMRLEEFDALQVKKIAITA